MPNGDTYPCHMYATNRLFCTGNIKNTKAIHFNDDNCIYKLRNAQCNNCWARKLCHICPPLRFAEKDKSVLDKNKCADRLRRYDFIIETAVFGENDEVDSA